MECKLTLRLLSRSHSEIENWGHCTFEVSFNGEDHLRVHQLPSTIERGMQFLADLILQKITGFIESMADASAIVLCLRGPVSLKVCHFCVMCQKFCQS